MTLLVKKKKKRKVLSVTLDEDVLLGLKGLAKKHKLPISYLTEQLIVNSMKELEETAKQEELQKGE